MVMLYHKWRMGITPDRDHQRRVSGKDVSPISPTSCVRLGESTPLQATEKKKKRNRIVHFGSSTSVTNL